MRGGRMARPRTQRRALTMKTPRPSTDKETRVTADHHQSVRLWLRLLTCTSLIEKEVRRRLRTAFGVTLPRYDLMSQLERHPEGLKMSELSKRMMVTGGNVTGITDQLVAEGLVVRDANPRDRRAYLLKLTSKGRRAFGAMAQAHEPWIIEMFAGLSETEKERLYGLLEGLKRHVLAVSDQEPAS
jgi:DNA-binding MarR family transcriptional regulator